MIEYISLYLEWCQLRRQHIDTVSRKRSLLIEVDSALNLNTASKIEIETYLLRKSDGQSDSIYNQRVTIIRTFFQWLEDNDYIRKSPVKKLEFKSVGIKYQRWFNLNEINKILYTPPKKNTPKKDYLKFQLIFELIAFTGIRRMECIKALRADLHIDCDEPYLIIRKTKNGDDRLVPLPVAYAKKLKEFTDNYSVVYLFETKSHRPLARATVTKAFERRLKSVGLYERNVGLHALRRSRITRLIEGHADNAGVMLIAGHKKMETTMRYFYYSMGYIQEQARKDPLFINH